MPTASAGVPQRRTNPEQPSNVSRAQTLGKALHSLGAVHGVGIDEFPALRGLQGRHASDVGSDIGADPPVALPALSREVGVATTAAGTSGTTPYLSMRSANNTTLACVLTDAALDKRGCAILARIASAGIARAANPAFTPVDGDVVFCLASGSEPPPAPGLAARWALTVIGTVAATVTAAAIRDAVRQAA
jgi:Peptidase family S58